MFRYTFYLNGGEESTIETIEDYHIPTLIKNGGVIHHVDDGGRERTINLAHVSEVWKKKLEGK